MAQESLLQMLEDLAGRVRSLELEKRQAAARAQALERENKELISLITLAGEKVDVLINGRPIAQGEVVVVDENFGVRITDVVSRQARLSPQGR